MCRRGHGLYATSVAYCGGKTVALSQRGGARSVHPIGHQIEPITEEVPVMVERP